MKTNINSFWIQGRLSEINWLSILSFLKHGHTFTLYTYERNLNFPANINFDGLILKDARLIMPEIEIFFYKRMMNGNPHFKFGGIAERMKAEMLYQLGGWHVDLDVVCLRNFDSITGEYVLRPHPINGKLTGVVGNIIKAPVRSELAKRYVEWTKTITPDNTDWEKSFRGLNEIVSDLNLKQYIVSPEILGYDSQLFWKNLKQVGVKLPDVYKNVYAIHFCNAMQEPNQQGSFYSSLLSQYNLA